MDTIWKEAIGGVLCILLGLLVFFGIEKFSGMIYRIGEGLTFVYFKLFFKDWNREDKHIPKVENIVVNRITNGMIKCVGLLFVVVGVMYLLSILFRGIT